jgi:hypothetical protein
MQLILPATIVLQLQNELRRAGRREIGGLLLAEHLHDEAFRLAEVTVQRTGGSAVHFVRDPALNQKQLDQFFKKPATTQGSITSVNGTPTPALSRAQVSKTFGRCNQSLRTRLLG